MATPLILLAEDEIIVQVEIEQSLREAGFEVTCVSCSRDALALLDDDVDRYRGVITDIRLADSGDGWDVGRRARELCPHMPVVYMSGDSAVDWSSKGVPNSSMLVKPFAPAQLVTAISALLNQEDARRVGLSL